ncbi:MAG: rod shape-determining protein MreC [Bacteroidales bacterium]|nr:rod shape-determining protein MreC [Bacteroidales bacterium]
MSSLFRYLLKNYGFFLFFSLEIISFVFIFSNNSYQRAKYLNSASQFIGSIYETYSSVTNYFNLSKVNSRLAAENARLRSNFKLRPSDNDVIPDSKTFTFIPYDSGYFKFVSAKVVNNSVNKPYNYIVLNKGGKDGIKTDQGIISADGIVGMVTNVTDNYSLGLSVLNQHWSVSSKIKKSNFFCSLYWDGKDYRYANLMEVPFHVSLQLGDTIVTSGYSSIFPEGVLIGTIESFEQLQGENYYDVRVKLSVDFKTITYVEIVENKNTTEINQLEKLIQE